MMDNVQKHNICSENVIITCGYNLKVFSKSSYQYKTHV
jgi:hypothetical protein